MISRPFCVNSSVFLIILHNLLLYREVAAMANELRQLVDTANAPIFGIDLNGLVNEWNFKTAEITVRYEESIISQ